MLGTLNLPWVAAQLEPAHLELRQHDDDLERRQRAGIRELL